MSDDPKPPDTILTMAGMPEGNLVIGKPSTIVVKVTPDGKVFVRSYNGDLVEVVLSPGAARRLFGCSEIVDALAVLASEIANICRKPD